jgi:hypothetical protein
MWHRWSLQPAEICPVRISHCFLIDIIDIHQPTAVRTYKNSTTLNLEILMFEDCSICLNELMLLSINRSTVQQEATLVQLHNVALKC